MITHHDFVYGGQMMYNTLDPSITATCRFTYRDSQENVLIYNEFQMTVTDEKVTEDIVCYDEFVTKDASVNRDYKVAFDYSKTTTDEWTE
jgi:hypothetical protein